MPPPKKRKLSQRTKKARRPKEAAPPSVLLPAGYPPLPPRARPPSAFESILSIVGAFIRGARPPLAPGETELLPALRTCPVCGWQAGAECRMDIECPRDGTKMPYVGSEIVGVDGTKRPGSWGGKAEDEGRGQG